MKKNILKLLSILTIILSLIFISSCNNNNNKDSFKYLYKDELGFMRKANGLSSECVILNNENYANYKDNLLGDSGESGLLNKELHNLNENELDLGNYYLVYVFYYEGNVKINFNSYLKFSLVTAEDVLYDEEAVSFGDISYRNYKMNKRTSMDVEVGFDKTRDSSDKIRIIYDTYNFYTSDNTEKYNYLFFSVVLPFNVDKYGKLDINFKVNDSKVNYNLDKNFSYSFEEELDDNLAKIDNYKVSYISEYLCEDGNIDDSLLSDEAYFSKNNKKLMVTDFDIKALANNNGNEKISLVLYLPKDSIIESRIEDAPTTERQESESNNTKIMKLALTIPREKDGVKHCRIIYSLTPLVAEDNVEINLILSGRAISVNDYKKESLIVNIADNLFKYWEGKITSIKDKTITEVNIPATYDGMPVSIGDEVFKDCKDLAYVNIENGVKSIGKKAFENCSSLKKIIIPDSIEEVYSTSFDGCPSSLFKEENNCKYIGNENNDYFILLKAIDKEVTSISINANTKVLGCFAFSNCLSLKKMNIMNVEHIGYCAFNNCFELEEITLHNNLKSIGKHAFLYCIKLKKIGIPSSVRKIDEDAFDGCTGLTSLEIEEGVTTIGDRAFNSCRGLTSITIPSSVVSMGFGVCVGCDNLERITIPFIGEKRYSQDDLYQYPLGYFFGIGTLGEKTMQYFKCVDSPTSSSNKLVVQTEKYDIPENLKEVIVTDCDYIQYGAFSNCSNLTSIKLLCNIKTIEGYAFKGCTSLTELSIPDSVTSIDSSAFDNCQIEKLQCSLPMLYHINTARIKELYVTSGDEIEEYRFRYWYTLEKVVIGDGISVIGDHAFDSCTKLKEVSISKNVTSIGNSAFNNCAVQILEIPIVFNLEYLGISKLFLREVYLNRGTEIPANAFRDSTTLEKVGVLDEITSIGQYAFSGCSSLKEVNILNSVTDIGAGAFANCAITSLTLPDTLETIGSNAFFKCPIEKASIPSMAINYIEKTSLKEVTITSGTSISNVAFANCLYLTKVELPLGLETIGYSAFKECKALKNVSIPNTVTSIGKSAFMYCTNLQRINLPEGLTTIEESLFYSCSSLLSITIPSTVTSIGNEAFYRCEKMVEVYNLSSIIISKGGLNNGYAGAYAKAIHSNLNETSIITIDDNGFVFAYFDNNYYLISYKGNETELILPKNFNYYINDKAIGTNYNLTKVIIGKNVIGLLNAIFVDCINLKDIYYEGTEQDWYDITIAIGSDYSYLNITYNYSA